MSQFDFKPTIFLLLALMTAGGQVFAPLVASANDKHPFCLHKTEADSDEIEDSSELTLESIVDCANVGFEATGFHAVCDKVNHQIDWLFIHEHPARAPPLV